MQMAKLDRPRSDGGKCAPQGRTKPPCSKISQTRRCFVLQMVKLDRSRAIGAPAVGDVLRACTCTTFVFPTKSLFGINPPQRHIITYGADDQKWPQARCAISCRCSAPDSRWSLCRNLNCRLRPQLWLHKTLRMYRRNVKGHCVRVAGHQRIETRRPRRWRGDAGA